MATWLRIPYKTQATQMAEGLRIPYRMQTTKMRQHDIYLIEHMLLKWQKN